MRNVDHGNHTRSTKKIMMTVMMMVAYLAEDFYESLKTTSLVSLFLSIFPVNMHIHRVDSIHLSSNQTQQTMSSQEPFNQSKPNKNNSNIIMLILSALSTQNILPFHKQEHSEHKIEKTT